MPNFWEPKGPGHWAHGFLICGATQTTGYEFHGSFPRNGGLPHISVYEIGKTSTKVCPNLQFRNVNGSVGLNTHDRGRFAAYGVDQSVRDAFIRAVWDRHLALNPPHRAVFPAPVSINTNDRSAFPPLGGGPATPPGVPVPYPNAVPPLLSQQPTGLSPAGLKEYAALPGGLKQVLAASGAFD